MKRAILSACLLVTLGSCSSTSVGTTSTGPVFCSFVVFLDPDGFHSYRAKAFGGEYGTEGSGPSPCVRAPEFDHLRSQAPYAQANFVAYKYVVELTQGENYTVVFQALEEVWPGEYYWDTVGEESLTPYDGNDVRVIDDLSSF